MKFNKEYVEDFNRNPSLSKLKELLSNRESAAQEAVNNTRDDHRYFQGFLKSIQELQRIINEATER